MEADGTPFYQSGPGLWYDRRRDEHSVNQRSDSNVWAPFMELPWARSGQFIAGQGAGDNIAAWDGLSRYDLTRYNTWYFQRNCAFADLCLQHGLVDFHSLYNSHNVLEWVPSTGLIIPGVRPTTSTIPVFRNLRRWNPPATRPGRTSGFTSPTSFTMWTIPTAGLFTTPIFSTFWTSWARAKRDLRRRVSVPRPAWFPAVFLDTVAEWEKQTGRTVRIELATSKDITDAILADPIRSKQISVIDMRYWQYRPDGSLGRRAG